MATHGDPTSSQSTAGQPNPLPRHMGFIMDGNRRWAKAHGVPTLEGHRKGYEVLSPLLPVVQRLGIPYITIYAFSTENWNRAEAEVAGLMKLLLWVAKHELKTFLRQNIRLRIVGAREHVPPDVAKALANAEEKTAHCNGLTMSICFNYGGQQEIADAVKSIVTAGIKADDITPELVAEHLYAPDLPPLDLVVRTSGEQRISGFMLWSAAYAELYFTETLWPDFDEAELMAALHSYAERGRRFGA